MRLIRLLDEPNFSRCLVTTVVRVTRVIVVNVLPSFVVVVVVVTVSPSFVAIHFKSLMLSTLLNVRNVLDVFVVVVVDADVDGVVLLVVPADDESNEFVSVSRSEAFGILSGAKSARFSRKKEFFNFGLFVTDAGNDRASGGSDVRSAQLFCFCFFDGRSFFGFCWRRSEKNHSGFGFRCSVAGSDVFFSASIFLVVASCRLLIFNSTLARHQIRNGVWGRAWQTTDFPCGKYSLFGLCVCLTQFSKSSNCNRFFGVTYVLFSFCLFFVVVVVYDMAIKFECVSKCCRCSASFVPVWHRSNTNLSPPFSFARYTQSWECQSLAMLFISCSLARVYASA